MCIRDSSMTLARSESYLTAKQNIPFLSQSPTISIFSTPEQSLSSKTEITVFIFKRVIERETVRQKKNSYQN